MTVTERAVRARAIAESMSLRVAAAVPLEAMRADTFLPAIAEPADAALDALLHWERTGSSAAAATVRVRTDELVVACAAAAGVPLRRRQSGSVS